MIRSQLGIVKTLKSVGLAVPVRKTPQLLMAGFDIARVQAETHVLHVDTRVGTRVVGGLVVEVLTVLVGVVAAGVAGLCLVQDLSQWTGGLVGVTIVSCVVTGLMLTLSCCCCCCWRHTAMFVRMAKVYP